MTHIIHRGELHKRIERVQPVLLHLTAPAGYGKSAFLEQLARSGPSIFFAHLNSLETDRIDDLLAQWSAMPEGTRLIIDTADALSSDDGLARACERLVAERPAGGSFVYASREPSYFFERVVAPHDVLSLDANYLRFLHMEIEELFAGTGVGWQTVHTIEQITRGWPAIVLFLRRLHDEGRLDAFLADPLENTAADELFSYLRHELLAPLEPNQRQALLLVSAATDFSVSDIAPAASSLPDARAFEQLEARGIITRIEDSVEVPWIVRHILRKRTTQPSALLTRLAETMLGFDDLLRAAELYLENGNEKEAARCLRDAQPRLRGRDIGRWHAAVARLSLQTLCMYRSLWWTTIETIVHTDALSPRSPVSNASELAEHASTLHGQERWTMLFTSALLSMHDGMLGHARRVLTTVFANTADDDPRFRAFVAAALSLAEALGGDAAGSETWWERACEFVPDAPMLFPAKRFLARIRIVCDEGRLTQAWQEIRALFDMVLAHAGSIVAVRCAQSLYNSGFFADDATVREYAIGELQALCASAATHVDPILALYRDGILPPCRRMRVHIVHHAIAIDVLQRKGDIHAAREMRDAALALLARSDDRAIVALVERAARSLEAPAPPAADAITLELGSGRCRDAERTVDLPDRSVQLLALLAARGRAVARDELCDALWGDLDYKAQQNALKTCAHRTRALIDGGRGVLVSVRDGYHLRGLQLDVLEAERVAAQADRRDRAQLSAAAELLSRGLPAHMRGFECFVALESRLRNAAERAWNLLGEWAIADDDGALLERAVEALDGADPMNQVGVSLMMRWHIVHGDRASAIAALERFKRHVAQGLASTSETLERLLREPAS